MSLPQGAGGTSPRLPSHRAASPSGGHCPTWRGSDPCNACGLGDMRGSWGWETETGAGGAAEDGQSPLRRGWLGATLFLCVGRVLREPSGTQWGCRAGRGLPAVGDPIFSRLGILRGAVVFRSKGRCVLLLLSLICHLKLAALVSCPEPAAHSAVPAGGVFGVVLSRPSCHPSDAVPAASLGGSRVLGWGPPSTPCPPRP